MFIGIHLNDIDEAIATYELMSKKYFTHATPPCSMLEPQNHKCHRAYYKCKKIVLMEFMTPKRTAKISQSAGEETLFTTYEPQDHTFAAPTEPPTELSPAKSV